MNLSKFGLLFVIFVDNYLFSRFYIGTFDNSMAMPLIGVSLSRPCLLLADPSVCRQRSQERLS